MQNHVVSGMTKFGFLSFGHYADVPGTQVRTAADMLHQSIDLAVGAEQLGLDGAYFRVHHFARQAASPIPLLAAIGARTSSIELGTGVIDLRYEQSAQLAEQASAVDLIAGGERLQLGVSRGSPEPALRGWEAFDRIPEPGETPTDLARRQVLGMLRALEGEGVAPADPEQAHDRAVLTRDGMLRIEPRSESLRRRIWWGAGSTSTALWAAEQGLNLQSSTLLLEDDGRAFGDLQASQIEQYRAAWREAGWDWEPRVSVSRSIIPVIDEESERYFGIRAQAERHDQVGLLEGVRSRFGRSYIGSPDRIIEELKQDAAIAAADTVLVTVPNMLGVDFNLRLLESIVNDIKPALG